MSNTQKCAAVVEADGDALISIIDKALVYPRAGVNVGGGRRLTIQSTWDGFGETPSGWTKQRQVNWVASSSNARVPIPDALATELQLPVNQARLTSGEAITLNAAIAGRANTTLSSGGYVPKFLLPVFDESRILIFVLTGQSLQRSDAEGGTGPFPIVPYWSREQLSSTSFTNIAATCGSKDLQIARNLANIGRRCLIMNFAYSATTSADWLPPSGLAWSATETSFSNALSQIVAQLGGKTPNWIHYHDQGEKNVSDAGGQSAALQWAENAAVLFAKIEEMAGTAMPHIIGITKDPQPTNYWINIVRSEEYSAAIDINHTLNRDSFPYKADNIHLTHPIGERMYGVIQANKALELIP